MKPITMTISAFGSYADEQSIDFTKLDQGLFLISGNTGSGKTTLFDALIYALYDRTSGGKRDGSMMRSQYASGEISTYVKLQFENAGKIYTIIRSPEYERESKRKDKEGNLRMVSVKANVELIFEDGTSFIGKKREIDKKIIEIIGLEANQFMQTVMLAQGEFMQLLQAESKERKVILSKIFDTRIFSRIQEQLKQQTKILENNLEQNFEKISNSLQRLAIDEEQLKKDWTALVKEKQPDLEKSILLLRSWNMVLGKEIKELEKKEEENDRKLNEINTLLTQALTINQQLKQLEKITEKKEWLEVESRDINHLEECLEKAKRAKVVLVAEQNLLKAQSEKIQLDKEIEEEEKSEARLKEKIEEFISSLKQEQEEQKENLELWQKEILDYQQKEQKYDELEEKEIKEKNLTDKLKEVEKKRKEQEKKLEQKNIEQEKNQNLALKLPKIQLKQKEISLQINKNQERQKELKKLFLEKKILNELEQKEKKVKESYVKEERVYQAAYEEYEQAYLIYLNEQAGILASELKENLPCPVCGSLQHPHLAVLSDKAVSKEEVESLKKVRNCAEEVRDQASENLLLIKNEKKIKQQWIFEEEKRILEENLTKEAIEEKLEDIQTEEQQLKKENKLLLQKEKEGQKAEKNLSIQQKQIEELVEKLEQIKNDEDRIKLLCTQNNSSLEEMKKFLPYTKEDALARKIKAENNLETENKKVEQMSIELERIHKELNQKTGKCFQLKENRKSKENESIEKADVFESTLIQQGFSVKEEYQKAILEEKEIEKFSLKIKHHQDNLLETKTIYTSLNEQLAGKEKIETIELERQKEEGRQEKEKLSVFSRALYYKKETAKEVEDVLLTIQKENEGLLKQYSLYSGLNKTANGGLNGKAKVDLETFVLRKYFKQVIAAANQRLVRMNGGEFVLQCTDLNRLGTRGESGLNLEIYSQNLSENRDIRTLSGGESFMAALAMALGLSDVIQNSAGIIHLETMFVDEGFGSLDERSREQAITILKQLAGQECLIGIISHVSELKDEISQQLIVEKTPVGSKLLWKLN